MGPSLLEQEERQLQDGSCRNATFICSSNDDCCSGLSCETIGSRNQISVCVGESFDEVGASNGLTFGLIFMSSLILLFVFWCCLRICEPDEEEDTEYLTKSKKGTRHENLSLLSSKPPANRQLDLPANTDNSVKPMPMADPNQKNLRYRPAKKEDLPSRFPSINVGGNGI